MKVVFEFDELLHYQGAPIQTMIETLWAFRDSEQGTRHEVEIWELRNLPEDKILQWLRTHAGMTFSLADPKRYFEKAYHRVYFRMRPPNCPLVGTGIYHQWIREAREMRQEPELVFCSNSAVAQCFRDERIPTVIRS